MKRIKITDKYWIEVNSFDGWLNFNIVEKEKGIETFMGETSVYDDLESALEEIKRRMIFDLMPEETTLSQYIEFQIEVGDIIRGKIIGELPYTYKTPNSIKIPNVFVDENINYSDNSKNTFIDKVHVFDNRKK